ncbi:Dinucleoside triphosphate hydrolase [Diatrype stigma]|uniref:Bis(5'-adenosyl)-triphosphatase n=1 Tax=Diatrype stigma TaxID=117547 RepID=A0AAN9UU55_9PEZI
MIRKGGMVTVNPFSETWKRKMNTKPAGPVYFGPFEVTPQVFLTTPHSFALVNLKPLLPGHVLVCPLEPHKRLTDLSAPELTDLFQAVQRVQRMLARHYFSASHSSSSTLPPSTTTTTAQQEHNKHASSAPAGPEAGSFNLAIQDGSGAGQTVPHVHVHVIPRIAGETEKDGRTVGDAVYEQMAAEEGNVGGALWDRDRGRGRSEESERPVPGGGFARIEDASRRPRSAEEMAAEADVFRGVLAAMAREEAVGEAEKEKGKDEAGDGR